MFSSDELRRFLRDQFGEDVTHSLPDSPSSPWQLVTSACDVLERRGLIDGTFFAALRQERPRRSADIDVSAELWLKLWSSPEQLSRLQNQPRALSRKGDRTISARFLVRGAAAAKSVARVRVHRHFGGEPRFHGDEIPDCVLGTGWLITPNLVITTHHLIAARYGADPPVATVDFDRQARSTTLHFDYLAADSQIELVQAIEAVAADPTLDFALLRLPTGDRPPLRLRRRLLERSRDTPLSECVNVLQHPDGGPMRIGLRNNFVVHGDATWLSYLTDTRHGAAGSPVCDDEWAVVALHRGYRELTGVSITLDNVAVRTENYGVQLAAVLEWLRQHAPEVQREIEAAQSKL